MQRLGSPRSYCSRQLVRSQAAEIGSDLIKTQREGRASLHDEDMAWFEEIQKENDWLKGDDYDLYSSI